MGRELIKHEKNQSTNFYKVIKSQVTMAHDYYILGLETLDALHHLRRETTKMHVISQEGVLTSIRNEKGFELNQLSYDGYENKILPLLTNPVFEYRKNSPATNLIKKLTRVENQLSSEKPRVIQGEFDPALKKLREENEKKSAFQGLPFSEEETAEQANFITNFLKFFVKPVTDFFPNEGIKSFVTLLIEGRESGTEGNRESPVKTLIEKTIPKFIAAVLSSPATGDALTITPYTSPFNTTFIEVSPVPTFLDKRTEEDRVIKEKQHIAFSVFESDIDSLIDSVKEVVTETKQLLDTDMCAEILENGKLTGEYTDSFKHFKSHSSENDRNLTTSKSGFWNPYPWDSKSKPKKDVK